MENKKSVLLLGGTGAMGVYLAPELARLGYRVYVTSRGAHVSDDESIEYIQGDAKNPAFLQPLLERGFDAVVDFMLYTTREFSDICQRLLSGTSHYLFLSSYRVYGDTHGEPITEESPRLMDTVDDPEYLATDEYSLRKTRQEDILRSCGRRNWTILRPAVTYSTRRFQLGPMEADSFLRRTLEGKKILFPRQMLGKQATMTWAGDVAAMIGRLVLNEAAFGEAYTVSTAEHHSWEEILGYYSEILPLDVKLVDLPVFLRVFGRKYQILYDRMFDRVIDNTKILRVTGLRQDDFLPLRDGLAKELRTFLPDARFGRCDAALDKRIDEVISPTFAGVLSVVRRKLRTAARLLLRGGFFRALFAKLFSRK